MKDIEHPVIMIVPVDPMDRPAQIRDEPYEPSEGMIPFPCQRCGIKGWYGIRQAMLKTQKPETPIFCMMCVIKWAKEAEARGEKVASRLNHLGGT